MEHDRPHDRDGVEAAVWAEGCRRRRAIQDLLGRHRGGLTTGDVLDVARDLGVSRATLYRLIRLYRDFGSVDVLLPKRIGRRRGTRVLSSELETIIRTTIQQACRGRHRPTLTDLVAQVHARCLERDLPLPHRRTVRARLATATPREPSDPEPSAPPGSLIRA